VKVGASHFDAWFLADQPHNERAASAAEVAKVVAAAGQGLISVSKNLRQALRRAQSIAEPGDTLVVFGSFHTVAEILPRLHKDQQKNGVQ
jgi:dihydrofolate synthase/folylpolyglutamate synthase